MTTPGSMQVLAAESIDMNTYNNASSIRGATDVRLTAHNSIAFAPWHDMNVSALGSISVISAGNVDIVSGIGVGIDVGALNMVTGATLMTTVNSAVLSSAFESSCVAAAGLAFVANYVGLEGGQVLL